MTMMASQITSLTLVYSTVYSDADQRKYQSSASLAFVWGIHRDRWIPHTKGQLRGKCFYLMTSSCWKEYGDHRNRNTRKTNLKSLPEVVKYTQSSHIRPLSTIIVPFIRRITRGGNIYFFSFPAIRVIYIKCLRLNQILRYNKHIDVAIFKGFSRFDVKQKSSFHSI